MIFTEGLSGPEGPVVLEDRSLLCVEMGGDKGTITHISPKGDSQRIVAKTGRPNGLAVDRNGVIWTAESLEPSLLKVSMDGEVEVFLTECNGEVFLFPNDLAFGFDGALYLTDSGIIAEDFVKDGKVRDDYKEIDYDGRVYRIDIGSGEISKIDTGIRFTNGIAFDPEDNLYVNETITGNVYRYQNLGQGRFGPREYFGNVMKEKEYDEIRGPDGMKFGLDGNLYVTVYGQRDITVLGPDGGVVERIATEGLMPSNLAFGLGGEKKIYVTDLELGRIELIDVKTEGLPLHK